MSSLALASAAAVMVFGVLARSAWSARGAPAVTARATSMAGADVPISAGANRDPASATPSPSSRAAPKRGGAFDSPPPSEPEKRRACLVAAIGDSLTDERSHGGKYLAYVAQRCPETRIENFGRGGDMVNQMRRRFFSDVLPRKTPYTHLVVFGGVNDLYSDLTAGRTPEKVARDLGSMYQAAHERGMRVVALTVAPWGGFKRYFNVRRGRYTVELNRWIGSQRDTGLADAVVDAYSLLSCGEPEKLCPDYSIDGIHFNARGHEVLGKALYEAAFRDCP